MAKTDPKEPDPPDKNGGSDQDKDRDSEGPRPNGQRPDEQR